MSSDRFSSKYKAAAENPDEQPSCDGDIGGHGALWQPGAGFRLRGRQLAQPLVKDTRMQWLRG